jgi:uncharacterized membrane protein
MAHLPGGVRTASSKNIRYRPNTEDMNSTEERADAISENVGNAERLFSGLLGGGLLLRSMRVRSGLLGKVSALIGIALLQRAATGYCPAYAAFGVGTHDPSDLADTAPLGRR